jgi:hypothetical protein
MQPGRRGAPVGMFTPIASCIAPYAADSQAA